MIPKNLVCDLHGPFQRIAADDPRCPECAKILDPDCLRVQSPTSRSGEGNQTAIVQIPKEILDRHHRALCRRVAAMIIHAMGETDTSCEELDRRRGVPAGTASAWLNAMISGETNELRDISDLAAAMDVVPVFSMSPYEKRTAPAAEPQP